MRTDLTTTQADWDDFWNSESEGRELPEFIDTWNEMEKIEPLTPIKGENNGPK